MQSRRVSWVDIARGIGIIAVLYGHAVSGDSYRHLIYAFHMPLFFFLSGIVFSPRKNSDFLPFLRKNFKTIIIPYLLFAFLSYLIWLANRSSLPAVESVYQHFIGVIYGNSNGLFFNVVLWFLPCLFVTKISFWLLTKISLRQKYILPALAVLSVVAYIFSLVYPGIKLPFGIETAMTATVFFGFGYLWKINEKQIMETVKKIAWPTFFGLVAISIIFASINFDWYGYQIDMRLNRYSNFFLFYLSALSGIGATLMISYIIGSNRVLEFIGQKSLELFIWHIIVFTYFTHYLRMVINSETIDAIRNTYLAPIYTVTAIFIILAITILYNRLIAARSFVFKR